MVRSLARLPTAAASENSLVTTTSRRSSTSSCALASSVRTKASSVAMRRCSGRRATAWALATVAKRSQRRDPAGGNVGYARKTQGKQPHFAETFDGA